MGVTGKLSKVPEGTKLVPPLSLEPIPHTPNFSQGKFPIVHQKLPQYDQCKTLPVGSKPGNLEQGMLRACSLHVHLNFPPTPPIDLKNKKVPAGTPPGLQFFLGAGIIGEDPGERNLIIIV